MLYMNKGMSSSIIILCGLSNLASECRPLELCIKPTFYIAKGMCIIYVPYMNILEGNDLYSELLHRLCINKWNKVLKSAKLGSVYHISLHIEFHFSHEGFWKKDVSILPSAESGLNVARSRR